MALEQSVEGAVRSFTLNYIDWKNPENNVYHVTAEFSVERTRSHETARPDIVLFINGIPFAVIECKSPKTEVDQAVSQTIRNQRDEYIPTLYTYAQLVIGSNKNHCKYATVGTAAKYWSVWREEREEKDEEGAALRAVLDRPLPQEAKAGLYELLAEGLGLREPDAEYLIVRSMPCAGPNACCAWRCCSRYSTAGGARSPATSSSSPWSASSVASRNAMPKAGGPAASSGTPRARASR